MRDIQTEVSFVTTRVKSMDGDGWGKLKTVLKYLKGTKYTKLTLRVNSLLVTNGWIYEYYNTHDYCRGHTGTMKILGKGSVVSLSLNQRLNVKISTEGELVGLHDGMSVDLWSNNVIEYQVYTVEHNKLYQYNKSTVLMETNGRESTSNRTK